MTLKCASCGGDMEIPEETPENVNIKCPYCHEYVRLNNPQRIEVPTEVKRPRFVSDKKQSTPKSQHRQSDFHVRRQVTATPTPARTVVPQPSIPSSSSRKKCSTEWIIYSLLVIAIAGLGFYCLRKSRVTASEDLNTIGQTLPKASFETTAEIESKHSKQQNVEREKEREKIAREEIERKKRREEKERRVAEREKERREIEDKAERERKLRELMTNVEIGFNGAISVFASDFPSAKRPFDFTEDGVITVVDEDYVGGRSLYRLSVENKRLASVQRVSQRFGTEDVGAIDFLRAVSNKIVLAKMESGPVWICGNTKMNELIDIPESADAYAPLADFTRGALPVLNALHVVPPTIKYRVTLKAKKGKGEIKLGIVEQTIDLQSIRSRIRERITDRKLKRLGIGLKPPKMKKVKRTVMMYDGEIMKKEISGITKIPREPKFSAGYAYQKWEELRKEAERQDQEELEAEAENQRQMEEYRRKTDAALRDAKPTETEVDSELSLYRLLIERSRTKLKTE